MSDDWLTRSDEESDFVEEEWIPLNRQVEPETREKQVDRSGLEALEDEDGALDRETESTRKRTRIAYKTSGGWKGKYRYGGARYDTFSTPSAAATTDEGKPEIPQEGIYVAIPPDAENVTVELVEKTVRRLEGEWHLKPAPNWLTEEEYLAGEREYDPRSEIYESDEAYPGQDFEYLGKKVVGGATVAHLLVYLAQYRPLSGTLDAVESMTVEIAYDLPPLAEIDGDPSWRRERIDHMVKDMILDSEHVLGSRDHVRDMDMDVGPEEDSEQEPWRIPRLRSRNNSARYLIITPSKLEEAVQPLFEARRVEPWFARVVTLDQIKREFPDGLPIRGIRRFLSWAYDHWRLPPVYVVLAGDSDTVPVSRFSKRVRRTISGRTTWVWRHYASDHYYADLHDSLAPELVVSRIPASDPVSMKQICTRLAEAAEPQGGDWRKKVLLVAQAIERRGRQELPVRKYTTDCSDKIAEKIGSRLNWEKLYGDSTEKSTVVNKMESGAQIVNYRGHGTKQKWAASNGLTTSDILNLDNKGTPPVVFCICCQNAWIDDEDTETVVEAFLRHGKAVAVLGASRNSYTAINNIFDQDLFNHALRTNGEHGYMFTPGSIFRRAQTTIAMNAAKSIPHEVNVRMYMLFGDPVVDLNHLSNA